jgi:hypothetical protein
MADYGRHLPYHLQHLTSLASVLRPVPLWGQGWHASTSLNLTAGQSTVFRIAKLLYQLARLCFAQHSHEEPSTCICYSNPQDS